MKYKFGYNKADKFNIPLGWAVVAGLIIAGLSVTIMLLAQSYMNTERYTRRQADLTEQILLDGQDNVMKKDAIINEQIVHISNLELKVDSLEQVINNKCRRK